MGLVTARTFPIALLPPHVMSLHPAHPINSSVRAIRRSKITRTQRSATGRERTSSGRFMQPVASGHRTCGSGITPLALVESSSTCQGSPVKTPVCEGCAPTLHPGGCGCQTARFSSRSEHQSSQKHLLACNSDTGACFLLWCNR